MSPFVTTTLILAYVAIQLGIGFWASRRVQTQEDFFLAGRNMPMAIAGLSLFATWFGAETIIGSTGAIADGGLAGARAEPFGYAICLFAMAFLIAGRFRERGYVNLADFFRARFDARSELLAALITILVSTIWAAAQLLALAALLEAAIHVPAKLTLLVAVGVVVIYTSVAGITGDIYNDMLHNVLLVVGIVLVLVAVADRSGGFGAMFAAIEPNQLNIIAPGESWLARLDAWSIPVLGSLVTQEAMARFLTTKSARAARDATLLAAALYLALGVVPVLIALGGVHVFPIGADSDAYLPALASAMLTPVVYVIFAGALLSAVMSVTNANILSVSSMMTINVLGQLNRNASKRTKLWTARATTIGAGAAAYLIATSGQSIYDLIALTSVWGQAGILVAVLIGLWSAWGGARAALWAIVACMAVNVWTLAIDPLLSLTRGPDAVPLGQAWATLIAGDAPSMDGYFLLSVIVSLAAYALGALFDQRARSAGQEAPAAQ
jgi:Na+/proline symporter